MRTKAKMPIPCCISALDDRQPSQAQDVNLLHISPEPSFRTYSGGYAMADYRVYLVSTDGHFCDVIPLVCADDAEAIKHAQRLAVGHDVELWQLDRKVAVFQDKDKTP